MAGRSAPPVGWAIAAGFVAVEADGRFPIDEPIADLGRVATPVS